MLPPLSPTFNVKAASGMPSLGSFRSFSQGASSFALHALPPTTSSSSSASSSSEGQAGAMVLGQSVPFTLLAALAIAVSYADRSNLSTAIIPMAAEFNWDSLFSGVVLSAFWGGYALTQVLGGRLADMFGGEMLLVLAMVLWSAMTAATPHAATLGNWPVLAARVLLGAGEGLALPAIHSMIKKYVVPADRATSAAVITAACYLGALLSNLASPHVISAYGWEACFYGFAALPPLVWIPLWVLFLWQIRPEDGKAAASNAAAVAGTYQAAADTDAKTPIVVAGSSSSGGTSSRTGARKETDGLVGAPADAANDAAEEGADDVTAAPARLTQLLASPSVWAIICAQYGQSWGMIGLLSWLPTYYSQRFNVPLDSLANFTVLPYFLQMVMAVAAGFIADKLVLSGVRVLYVRHLLQISGMLAPAACLAFCAYSPGLTATEAATIITAGSAISSLTVGAVSVNHFDISPRNAGTIFGLGNTAACIGGLIAVPGSGWLFDRTQSWDAVFILFAAHYVGGAFLWALLASDQPLQLDGELPYMAVQCEEEEEENDDGKGSSGGSGGSRGNEGRGVGTGGGVVVVDSKQPVVSSA